MDVIVNVSFILVVVVCGGSIRATVLNPQVGNLESELQPGMFRDVFRVIPDPPPEECTPQRLVLKIENRADLW